MSDITKDIINCLLIVLGLWSFISGEFIISTIFFASAAIFSNISLGTVLKEG